MLSRYLPGAWAVLLSVLLLGPALGVGYVLTYDMVWVPDLALRPDFLGLGSGLPRDVPSDAVVAVLDEVVPGLLLQKVVLLGSLVAAGLGSLRLVGPGLGPRMVAVSIAVWNPYVVERLWLGQWTVLVCYAALPWLAAAAVRARTGDRVPARLFVLLPIASLSANAGIMAALVVLVLGLPARPYGAPRRTRVQLVAAVLAANAPWVVAGLLHASIADTAGSARYFALHGDGLPAPLAALSLGGVWNADVVPETRSGPVLPLAAGLLLLLVAVFGLRRSLRRLGRRTTGGLAACWAVGYGLAVVTWTSPAAVDWFAGVVPGGGLLRDGARSLALCVPLLVVLAADAVDGAVEHGREHGWGVLAAVAGSIAPIVLLPDAAWGIGGQLQATDYPEEWSRAREVVVAHPADGDLLVLPLGTYRRPPWNDGRTVLDPLGRFLPGDYLADDRLSVSGTVVSGEDPRIPRVRAALAQPDPEAVARALGAAGVGTVAIERDATGPGTSGRAGQGPDLAGTELFRGPTLRVVRLDADVHVRTSPRGWLVALALAWTAYAACLLVGLARCVASLRGRRDTRW